MNVVFERSDEFPQRSLTFTSSASDARLVLEAGRDTGREVESYTARLAVAGLHADTGVYIYGDDGLPAYFAALAQDWRGWSGSRGWSSLEGQFSLDSEHEVSEPSGWSRGSLPIRPSLAGRQRSF